MTQKHLIIKISTKKENITVCGSCFLVFDRNQKEKSYK